MKKLYSFLVSSTLSILAFRSFNIVLIWAVIESSNGDGLILGGIIALLWVFNLVALPISGELLDTFNKKRILIYGSIGALLSIGIFLINYQFFGLNVIIAALCASVLASTNSITSTSINTVIPFITDKNSYTKAIGLASTLNSFQAIIGAFIGGGLIAYLGVNTALVIISLIYSLSLALLFFVDIRQTHEQEESRDSKLSVRLLVGFRILNSLHPEKMICITAMVTNFVLTPLLTVVIPVFVANKLGGNVELLAFFEASFALGMLCGGYSMSKMDFDAHARLLPVLVGNILIGLGLLFFALSNGLEVKALSLFISGFGLTCKGVACNSLRALAVPDQYRSRLEAAIFFLCIITIPIGSQLFGFLVEKLGSDSIEPLVIFMGVLIISISSFFIFSKSASYVLRKKNQELDKIYIEKYPHAFSR